MKQIQSTHQKLHSNKDQVLQKLRNVLKEADLEEYEVKSIEFFLKHGPHRCPDGQEPVWDSVTLPDGTVVYKWVCK